MNKMNIVRSSSISCGHFSTSSNLFTEHGSVTRYQITSHNINSLLLFSHFSDKKKMAAAFSYTACPKFSLLQPPMAGQIRPIRTSQKAFVVTNPEQDNTLQEQGIDTIKEEQPAEQQMKKQPTPLRPVEKQTNVKSTGLPREFGGEWLSSVTRHVRIYAAYIDPETCEFDQTQIDKLTLILDPTEEFVWEDESCNKVYSYFQELVDHYEGAPLTEYTLRLIGSDVEHYIRKMLFDGEIQYNMDARVLNFSMGKPRVQFNTSNIEGGGDGQPQEDA